MIYLRRFLSASFFLLVLLVCFQCARRGSPTGGPKDVTPPVLIDSDPENFSIDFDEKRIRLYFNEYIKLQDVQNQLIISPPLKYQPIISPQGGASKYIEITLKDTLRPNTTYTLNFGQSIVDNNENNPNSFLSYVFSTGSYIDSLSVSGIVRDAFNKSADQFISVMLYEIDTSYNDSVPFNKPPYYLTNTLDSATVFRLNNLKAGKYAIRAIRDDGKNNLFDPNTDKIGFITDTVILPTDSVYTLTLFKEIPEYSATTPTLASANRIIFGFNRNPENVNIVPKSAIPDSIRTLIAKDPERDTLNFWFTPFERDSLIFHVVEEKLGITDTFTIKTRALEPDSLMFTPSHRGNINFEENFSLSTNIPIRAMDTSLFKMINQDTVQQRIDLSLDTLKNKITFDFLKEPNSDYLLDVFPGAITDFFGSTNDTLRYRLNTGSYADYGNLRLNLTGNITYPVIVQLTDEKGVTKREIVAGEAQIFEFNNIPPSKYLLRLIFDANENAQWDTGNYLRKLQPERVMYYPRVLEVRANWELEETFTVED